MKSFIKTHRRVVPTGKDEKDKTVIGGSSSTLSSPENSLMNNEEKKAKASFELISTNNPNVYVNSNYSPNKPFNNSTDFSPTHNTAADAFTITTKELSLAKHGNNKTSAPLYSLTLNDVSRSPKNNFFKYSRNLFSRNKDDTRKLVHESSSAVGIRGITTHNWDSTTANKIHSSPQKLSLDISSQPSDENDLKFLSISSDCEVISRRNPKEDSLQSITFPPKYIVNNENQKCDGSLDIAKETEILINRHSVYNSDVKLVDNRIHGKASSHVNDSVQNIVYDVENQRERIDFEDINSIKKRDLDEVNDSVESLNSKFSFEYDNLNQRNDSFRFHKTERSNFINSKEKEMHEDMSYEESEGYGAYEEQKNILLCKNEEEKDIESLVHEESLKAIGNSTEKIVSPYDQLIQDINEFDDDCKNCDDNEIDCSAELLESLINLTLKNSVINEEPVKPLQIVKFHNLKNSRDFKENTDNDLKYNWLDRDDENKDITNEHLDEVNKITEDFECKNYISGFNPPLSPAGKFTIFRSNSYPKDSSSAPNLKKIEVGGKTITLFRSHSYNDATTQPIGKPEDVIPDSNIVSDNRNETFTMNKKISFSPKGIKIHENLSPINENFEL